MAKGTPLLMHYVASKGAVIAMTRVLARELGEHGIAVNALAPGLIMSDTARANADLTGFQAQQVIASRAFKREAVAETWSAPPCSSPPRIAPSSPARP